ncbi:MAG: hypothetical protein Q9220_004601 [cf. Caloplaca sp. 1 TL-2023]
MNARIEPSFQLESGTNATGAIPFSSSAFGTPVHPTRPEHPSETRIPSILPISLPPATLRPLAFRTFTKKHNLTLTSSALQTIATFIGTHCGSGWRGEGLAEKVLDETAKAWKKNGGNVIVPGEGSDLSNMLQNLEECMVGGRIVHQPTLTRHSSRKLDQGLPATALSESDTRSSHDALHNVGPRASVHTYPEEDSHPRDPRHWLRIIDAFEQPHFTYNVTNKHFEAASRRTSLLPDPSHKTTLFHDRYHLVQQRLLRNEAFQSSTVTLSRSKLLQHASSEMIIPQQAYKLTPIANLLGRNGSTHVILGLLGTSPTGTLNLSDLTGSIILDLHHARPVPEDGAWFTPGMIVLTEGLYEEEGLVSGPGLSGESGIGGTIGGTFHVASIGGPPCERRDITLGVSDGRESGNTVGIGGFGWVDFLGVGSERANGLKMRSLEKKVLAQQDPASGLSGRSRIVVLGEVNLDSPKTLEALRHILGIYATEPMGQTPMTFILTGNFTRYAVLAGGGSGGSIEYKEYFDSLALTLSEYPSILENSTFVFVPGDNDPWASAFSGGAAAVLPKKGLPEIYTSRVKRAFAAANADAEKATRQHIKGEAVWSTNPTRITLFGPAQELVVFRDDISSRLRRRGLRFRPADEVDFTGTTSDNPPAEGMLPTDREGTLGADIAVDRMIEDAESAQPDLQDKGPANAGIPPDVHAARKLIKTILDQGHLSPFPLTERPVLWDHGNSLSLYPLPSALILMDPESPPFSLTYEGCHAMNPGALLVAGEKGVAQWIEYDARTRKSKTRSIRC